MSCIMTYMAGMKLAMMGGGAIMYADIIVRCMYIYMAFFWSFRMYRLSVRDEYSEWKRTLCLMTGVAMTILLIHQVLGIAVNIVLTDPSAKLLSLSKGFNMLSIPAVGVVSMMLTRHAILAKRLVLLMYSPLFVLLVLGTVFSNPVLDKFNVAFTAMFSTGLCMLGYLYYVRFNKALKEHYANTEVYDLSWLAVLLVLFLAASFMRTLMALVDLPGSHIFPLMVNMVIWYVMCRRVEDYEDAKVLGSIPSVFVMERSVDDLVSISKVDEQLGAKIREACYDKKMIVMFDFNSVSLADAVGCTKGELSQYFSNHNTTFFTYVNNLRLEYAAEMLRNSKDSVQDVGRNSGFGFDKVFRSLFEEKYGCSPSEYRSRC